MTSLACGGPPEPAPAPAPERAARAVEPTPEPEPRTPPEATPIAVPFGEGAADAAPTDRRLVVGDGYSCALRSDRTVACWGQHPGTESPTAATSVPELTGAIELAGDDAHLCARDGAGRVRCVGRGRDLEALAAIAGATSIGVAGAVCATLASGALRCAGLGEAQASTAADVDDALAVHSMHEHLCVGRRAHPALCFDAFADSWADVAESTGVARFGDVGGSACAIDPDGRATCTNDRFAPPAHLAQLDGQGARYCALTTAGRAHCFGPPSSSFDSVPGPRVVSIAARADHACILGEDDTVRCAGEDLRGEVSGRLPAPAGTATVVAGLGPMTDLAVGLGRACAIDATGALFAWGPESAEATRVARAPRLVALAGARMALCGVAPAGQVHCLDHDAALVVLRGIRVGTIADGAGRDLVASSRGGVPAVLSVYTDEPELDVYPELAGAGELAVVGDRALCGVLESRLVCAARDADVPPTHDLSGVSRFFADPWHRVAVTERGVVFWGRGDIAPVPDASGTIGRAEPPHSDAPIAAPSLEGMAGLWLDGVATRHDADGRIRRLVATSGESRWADVGGLEGVGEVRRVAASGSEGCVLSADGGVRCWGERARADGQPRVVAAGAWVSVALP